MKKLHVFTYIHSSMQALAYPGGMPALQLPLQQGAGMYLPQAPGAMQLPVMPGAVPQMMFLPGHAAPQQPQQAAQQAPAPQQHQGQQQLP